MPQAARTFRIFVSSTFNDLKAERNALQADVYPRLKELCERNGARFQAIDLRWGVSEEAALDQQTINICLTEVDRCRETSPRPNFIVLLGDRYGWRPPPPQIPAAELEAIVERVPARRALLEEWYLRDDNAVPPEYVLREREGDTEDFRVWEPIERELVSALGEAGRDVRSATEQEIERGALRVEDAPEHVFCFFRELTNLDDLLADIDRPSAEDFVDLVDPETERVRDTTAAARLADLKQKLRGELPRNVDRYDASWTRDGITTDHIARLCEDVWLRLSRVILEELAKLEEEGALKRETEAHERFGRDRARFFTGRADVLRQIADYLRAPSVHPLAIYGASGSGKSALLAKAAEKAAEAHADAMLVRRFVGATPESSDGRALLAGLCEEISPGDPPPAEYRGLVEELPKRLARAGAERPLIVFLDALDQLSDAEGARSLVWLPAELPENVRIVVSALAADPGEAPPKGSDALTALEAKLPASNLVALEPMSADEGGDLLDLWLEDAGRTLQSDQREEVLSKFRDEGRPLYLRLAFGEARRWRSFTLPSATTLEPGIPGIISQNLFARLERPENHGKVLVGFSLGYLAAAKNGISEDELLAVLSEQKAVLADFKKRAPRSPAVDRLPVVVWSRLSYDLEPYLTERSGDGTSLMSFYHRQLAEVATGEYLGTRGRKRHRELARHFAAEPLVREAGDRSVPNLRKLGELPYQQTNGELWDELVETLTDFEFLERKATDYGGVTDAGGGAAIHSGVFSLQEDYALALERMPGNGTGGGAAGKRRIIVTGTDLGEGLQVRCPHCNEFVPWKPEWLGNEEDCPLCGGPWKVNRFLVERPRWT